MKPFSFALIFAISYTSAFAQHTGGWCGTMQNVQRQIESDAQLSNQFDVFLQEFRDFQVTQSNRNSEPSGPEVFIPVVFHIVHDGDAIGTGENISEAQIMSQLDALNRDFNYLDPDIANVPDVWKNLVSNVNVKFCLAKFDPAGNPTSGIIRHQYAKSSWDTDTEIDNTLKPATIWDRSRYLNIWSVRMGGTLASSGVLAYATFPGFGSANADGVVSRFNTIGTTGSILAGYEKGKTMSHEVGHWLGLLHTWGFQAGCGGQGDFIDDTPDQFDQNFGCPSFPKVSCTGSAPWGDMFMNYMDYTDDGCRNMFTLKQAERMRSVLNSSRSSIKNAANRCFYAVDAAVAQVKTPLDTFCTLTFKPVITIKNEGYEPLASATIYYQFDGNGIQLYNWTGNLAVQQSVDLFLPVVTMSEGGHTFEATIANPNGLGNDANSDNDTKVLNFYVYNGAAAVALPLQEGFEVNFPPANWTIVNPNNDATWDVSFYGAYGLSNTCVAINNFSYTTNPNKRRDSFVTESYDFSQVQYPELKFDVAYARRSNTRTDSLNIYYSLNCGSSWQRVWGRSGSEMATAPDQSTLFTPQPEQWQTFSFPLTSLSGYDKVSFRFENVTGWGNVLYLDNINIANNPTLSIPKVSKPGIQVYPNTTDGAFIVNSSIDGAATIRLFNSTGQLVHQQTTGLNSTYVQPGNLQPGLYFVRVQFAEGAATSRLIIK